MNRLLFLVFAFVCLIRVCPSRADTEPLFFFYDPYQDPLASRDEYGLLHQMPQPNITDAAPRHATRIPYYFKSGEALIGDPAYVGALQRALRDNGYYCGPIDGAFSPAVANAIARMQKNYSLVVTGTLTVGVRRGLHLP